MRRRHAGQVWFEIEFEKFLELLGMAISGRAVVAMVHPQNGDIGLDRHTEVQKDCFVGPKICGNQRPSARLADGPARNFERRPEAQFGVPPCDLFESHLETRSGSVRTSRRFLPNHSRAKISKALAVGALLAEAGQQGAKFAYNLLPFD